MTAAFENTLFDAAFDAPIDRQAEATQVIRGHEKPAKQAGKVASQKSFWRHANNRPGGRICKTGLANEFVGETVFEAASKALGVQNSVQKPVFTVKEAIRVFRAFPMLNSVIGYLADVAASRDADAKQIAAEKLTALANDLVDLRPEMISDE